MDNPGQDNMRSSTTSGPPGYVYPQNYPPAGPPSGGQPYYPQPGYGHSGPPYGYPPQQPQQQQQQQQQVVIMNNQPTVAFPPPVSLCGAIALSCLVFWFCGWLLGGIAFILASK